MTQKIQLCFKINLFYTTQLTENFRSTLLLESKKRQKTKTKRIISTKEMDTEPPVDLKVRKCFDFQVHPKITLKLQHPGKEITKVSQAPYHQVPIARAPQDVLSVGTFSRLGGFRVPNICLHDSQQYTQRALPSLFPHLGMAGAHLQAHVFSQFSIQIEILEYREL